MYSFTLATSILLALTASANAQSTSGTSAGLTMTLSDSTDCGAAGTSANWTVYVTYDTQNFNFTGANTLPLQIQSYTLSRAPTLEEQLDFSGVTPNEGPLNGDPAQCTLFQQTTNPDSNGNALHADQCYGLSVPAECFRFFLRN